jgi:uncharacterized protein
MVIDFHTHCFPDKLAGPALEKLSARSGGLKRWTDGTVDGIKRRMVEHCVDLSVVLHIATSPSQQRAVNDFAAEIDGGGIASFGSVHPDAPDAISEMERIKALGFRGVKFHPQYQEFAVDDPRVFHLYKKAAALGLITVFHAGNDLGFVDSPLASPAAMVRALQVFDGARWWRRIWAEPSAGSRCTNIWRGCRYTSIRPSATAASRCPRQSAS